MHLWLFLIIWCFQCFVNCCYGVAKNPSFTEMSRLDFPLLWALTVFLFLTRTKRDQARLVRKEWPHGTQPNLGYDLLAQFGTSQETIFRPKIITRIGYHLGMFDFA